MGLFRKKKESTEKSGKIYFDDDRNTDLVSNNPNDAYELKDLSEDKLDVVTEEKAVSYEEEDFIEVGLSDQKGEAEVFDTSGIEDSVDANSLEADDHPVIDAAAAEVEADYMEDHSDEIMTPIGPADLDVQKQEQDSSDETGDDAFTFPSVNTDFIDEMNESEELLTEEESVEKLPYGKYELKKLYQDIGEEYCNLYADHPEDAFAEKVDLVNRLKQQTRQMQEKVENICRSPLTFLLILVLSAQIAIPFVDGIDAAAVIGAIPLLILDLACILLFVQGLLRKVGSLGFDLINIMLTIFLILCYIPIFVTLILGIMMNLSGRSELSGMAMTIIILSVLLAVLNTIYFCGLKSTTISAKTIMKGRLIKWKSSVFVIFLQILQIIAYVLTLAGFVLFKNSLVKMVNNMCDILNDCFGITDATKMISTTVVNTTITNLDLANIILGILVSLIAIIILSNIGREEE